MANLLFLIIVAVVAVVLLLIKTNASVVFFALCGGDVLVDFANKNMAYVDGHLNSNLLPHRFTVSQHAALIVILLLPSVVVALLLKHNHGLSKWPLQIFPAVATGVLACLLVVPLLSTSIQNSIAQNGVWNILEQNQVPVVGLCIASSLVILVLDSYIHIPKRHH